MSLLAKKDYLLYKMSHMPFMGKYDTPSKRLIRYCWNNHKGNKIKYSYEQIAHGWAYDSTLKNLDQLTEFYGSVQKRKISRERARQILAKFLRLYYK